MNTDRNHVSTRKARVLKGVKEFWLTVNTLCGYHTPVCVEIVNRCYHRAMSRSPLPYPTDRHPPQATGCATEPRRDRSRADTHGGQAKSERGTGDATGGTGGSWDRASQGESLTGCAEVILVRGIGGAVADRAADGESHAERPGQAQHPQRETARQQRQTGRREPQNAADGREIQYQYEDAAEGKTAEH